MKREPGIVVEDPVTGERRVTPLAAEAGGGLHPPRERGLKPVALTAGNRPPAGLNVGVALARSEVAPCRVCKRPIITILAKPVCSTGADRRNRLRAARRAGRERLDPALYIVALLEKLRWKRVKPKPETEAGN